MEQILANKLDEISKQKEQILAQLNAVLGAEQVLKEMLEALQKEKNDKKQG